MLPPLFIQPRAGVIAQVVVDVGHAGLGAIAERVDRPGERTGGGTRSRAWRAIGAIHPDV
jgi:hypothetical protein